MDPSIFVDQKMVSLMGLVCFYCDRIPMSPTQLVSAGQSQCNHTFCDSCVAAHEPTTCPKCGETISRIVPDKKMAAMMSLMRVRCPNYGLGCRLTGTLRMETIPPTTPNGVESYNVGVWLQDHEQRCQYSKSKCKHCGLSMPKQRLDSHWRSECEKVPLDCCFSYIGCPAQFTRSELSKHETDKWRFHLKIFSKAFEKFAHEFFSSNALKEMVDAVERIATDNKEDLQKADGDGGEQTHQVEKVNHDDDDDDEDEGVQNGRHNGVMRSSDEENEDVGRRRRRKKRTGDDEDEEEIESEMRTKVRREIEDGHHVGMEVEGGDEEDPVAVSPVEKKSGNLFQMQASRQKVDGPVEISDLVEGAGARSPFVNSHELISSPNYQGVEMPPPLPPTKHFPGSRKSTNGSEDAGEQSSTPIIVSSSSGKNAKDQAASSSSTRKPESQGKSGSKKAKAVASSKSSSNDGDSANHVKVALRSGSTAASRRQNGKAKAQSSSGRKATHSDDDSEDIETASSSSSSKKRIREPSKSQSLEARPAKRVKRGTKSESSSSSAKKSASSSSSSSSKKTPVKQQQSSKKKSKPQDDEDNEDEDEASLVKSALNYLEHAIPWIAVREKDWRVQRVDWERKLKDPDTRSEKELIDLVITFQSHVLPNKINQKKVIDFVSQTKDLTAAELLLVIEKAIDWPRVNTEWHTDLREAFVEDLKSCLKN